MDGYFIRVLHMKMSSNWEQTEYFNGLSNFNYKDQCAKNKPQQTFTYLNRALSGGHLLYNHLIADTYIKRDPFHK